jgi:putative transposase
MAIWRRGKPDALLHHSDRGSQYTGRQRHRLQHEPVRHVWDNAAMESFFSSLKTERTARNASSTWDIAINLLAPVPTVIGRACSNRKRLMRDRCP